MCPSLANYVFTSQISLRTRCSPPAEATEGRTTILSLVPPPNPPISSQSSAYYFAYQERPILVRTASPEWRKQLLFYRLVLFFSLIHGRRLLSLQDNKYRTLWTIETTDMTQLFQRGFKIVSRVLSGGENPGSRKDEWQLTPGDVKFGRSCVDG